MTRRVTFCGSDAPAMACLPQKQIPPADRRYGSRLPSSVHRQPCPHPCYWVSCSDSHLPALTRHLPCDRLSTAQLHLSCPHQLPHAPRRRMVFFRKNVTWSKSGPVSTFATRFSALGHQNRSWTQHYKRQRRTGNEIRHIYI